MSKKKQQQKRGAIPNVDGALDDLLSMTEEAELDAALQDHVYRLMEDRPDLMTNIFAEMTDMVEAFVKEHGREPTGDELADLVFGDISEEELSDLGLEEDELDWILGVSRSLEDWGIDEEVDPWVVSQYCAHCGLPLGEGAPCFSIGARLKVLPFRRPEHGAVYYLPLPSEDRLIPSILVPLDSPAKKDGWDLVFPACCERCAEELRKTLKDSLSDQLERLQN